MEKISQPSHASKDEVTDQVQKLITDSLQSVDFIYSFISANKEFIDIPENEKNMNVQTTLEHLQLIHVLMRNALKSYFEYLETYGND